MTRWGEVRLVDWIDEEDVYEAAYTVDAALTWHAGRFATITVGGTNIFDEYPSQQDTETETGGLWDAVQMGSNGAFYFARASFQRAARKCANVVRRMYVGSQRAPPIMYTTLTRAVPVPADGCSNMPDGRQSNTLQP